MVYYLFRLIQMQCEYVQSCFSECKHALGQVILGAALVPIQNYAVSLQPE